MITLDEVKTIFSEIAGEGEDLDTGFLDKVKPIVDAFEELTAVKEEPVEAEKEPEIVAEETVEDPVVPAEPEVDWKAKYDALKAEYVARFFGKVEEIAEEIIEDVVEEEVNSDITIEDLFVEPKKPDFAEGE